MSFVSRIDTSTLAILLNKFDIASPFVRMEKDYEFFKTLLLKYCINRPPYCQKIYSAEELKSITEYVTNT